METTEKIKAKCYGVWGCPYYRTESGHTFSIETAPKETLVFYYGNVKQGENKMHMLTEEEKNLLFSKVEFIH